MSLRGLIFNRVAYIDENHVNYEDETNWIMKTILDAAIKAVNDLNSNVGDAVPDGTKGFWIGGFWKCQEDAVKVIQALKKGLGD